MHISKMNMDDLEVLKPILVSEFDEFWNYNILKKEIKSPASIYLVGKHGSEIVGFAGITITLDTAELNNIVIKKSHRGNGYASQLLNELIKIALQKVCIKINLEVASSNIVAINLYKKFGFEQVGLRKKYYNNKEDALLFTKNCVKMGENF